jgi:hypothetical protein
VYQWIVEPVIFLLVFCDPVFRVGDINELGVLPIVVTGVGIAVLDKLEAEEMGKSKDLAMETFTAVAVSATVHEAEHL